MGGKGGIYRAAGGMNPCLLRPCAYLARAPYARNVIVVTATGITVRSALLKPPRLIPTWCRPPRWFRPVYTVTNDHYAPKPFVRDCKLVPEGPIYRVEPPKRYPKTPWE